MPDAFYHKPILKQFYKTMIFLNCKNQHFGSAQLVNYIIFRKRV